MPGRKSEGGSRNLVRAFLERISARALQRYQDEITEIVRDGFGVYALYKGERLYYVGLASNLRSRIKIHLGDRHTDRWDRFSLYMVRSASHLRELESLVIRIANPAGNKQQGKLARAENLKPSLRTLSEARDREEREELFGKRTRRSSRSARSRTRARSSSKPSGRASVNASSVSRLVGRRVPYGRHKGQTFRARVRRSGEVEARGYVYPSLSAAAKDITKARVNGRSFWRVRRGGEYVRVKDL